MQWCMCVVNVFLHIYMVTLHYSLACVNVHKMRDLVTSACVCIRGLGITHVYTYTYIPLGLSALTTMADIRSHDFRLLCTLWGLLYYKIH